MSQTKTSNTTKSYMGYRLPIELIEEIKQAKQLLNSIDKNYWMFAEKAYNIVGSNIIGATELLAKIMHRDISTPQGYAKAWALSVELWDRLQEDSPLPNLFISHYIVVGKAFSAKVREANQEQYINELMWARDILRKASQFDWTVDYIRAAVGKEPNAVDDIINSYYKLIPQIEAHIINAPYYGINDLKGAIVARIGKIFVSAMKWAMNNESGDDLEQVEKIKKNIEIMEDANMIIFNKEQ